MFVQMYHPALGSDRQVSVALSSVDDHAARGWLLVDPDVVPPAPETPYLTTAALVSQIVSGTGPVGAAQRAALETWVEADDYAPAGQWDFTQAPTVGGVPIGTGTGDVTQEELDAVAASQAAHVVGVLYTGAAPNRPTAPGAFVLWNGDTDPGAKAAEGDLGVGW